MAGEADSPPAYSGHESLTTPLLEKADPLSPPDGPPSYPSSQRCKRRRAHRIVTLAVLGIATILYYRLFFYHPHRRQVKAYVSGFLSSSEWEGPTESLRNRNPLRTLWWRLRTGHLFPFGHGPSTPFFRKPGRMRALAPKEAEQLFLTVPTNGSAKGALHSYAGYSHVAGSEGDHHIAMQVKNQWERLLDLPTTSWDENVFDAGTKESKRMIYGIGARGCGHHRGGRHHRWGGRRGRWAAEARDGGRLNAFAKRETKPRVWTDRYYSFLTFPQPGSSATLFNADGEAVFNATLVEDAIPLDPTAAKGSEGNEPFHGLSYPGSAEGELVYANMGTIDDYAKLKEAGVSLEGKIAIVRYGGIFRGLKVTAAEKAGAAGVIIYTDPAEDHGVTTENGYKPYPFGPARQPSSLQRGSVAAISVYSGDPTTPGTPSYKDAERLSRDDQANNIPKIPSLPMSGQDAKVLLESLEGKGKQLGEEWKGEFGGVGYWTGPGEKVKLVNAVKENITTIWNTYALIPGHVTDEAVVIGNHRDAWAFGAADPNSGTAAVHEIIKGYGVLLKSGWRPLRTILIASWDGEEPGLIGSTEFAEDYEQWLKETAVSYLNLDVAAAGSVLALGASPSLAPLMINVTGSIPDPNAEAEGETLLHALARGEGKTYEEVVNGIPTGSVKPLGSGSDYTPFLQHVGIASTDMGFKPGKGDAIYHYHSIYDSAYWMDKFGDPEYRRHVAIAQALGVMGLRLADSIVLPIRASTYAHELSTYLDSVKRLVSASSLTGQALDFVPLEKAIAKVQKAADRVEAAGRDVVESLGCLTMDRDLQACSAFSLRKTLRLARKINKRLAGFEGGFIDKKGLPERPWYRSLVQAPGLWLGYGAQPFPGVTESITLDKSLSKAADELARLTRAIKRTAKSLAL